MPSPAHESKLNVWLADELTARGLHAIGESKQGNKRLDVEVNYEDVKIALEAEQGKSNAKRAEAVKDADGRLRDGLVDCAIAICYPGGLQSKDDLANCDLIYALRTHKNRPRAAKTAWTTSSIEQLAGVIRQVPQQMGEPDEIAQKLSVSLELAIKRLSESQKQTLAATLDLPPGKPIKLEFGSAQTSRYNQAAKRAMLVIATAVMFHARLDSVHEQIPALMDNRRSPPTLYSGEWPPPRASACAESDDPIGAFWDAWDLWLVVDYKPIFATARNALHGCAHDHAFSEAVRGIARTALQVIRNIVGLRHDLLGRIFHNVLDTARYDGSFYTTTAAATLLANLAIREDMCDWSDPAAIAKLRITDPACGTGTLLMAAAERIRDLSTTERKDLVSQALIERILTGYDVNLTATHLAATTLGLLSPTTAFRDMKIHRALLGVENGAAYLGSLEFLSRENQPRLLGWPTGVEQIESERESSQAEPADLVIMNPPFTRDSLRHDQFDREEEALLMAREQELFDGLPVHRSSNGNAFVALAKELAKGDCGAIAAVLPLVTATNASSLAIRRFLAEHFHVEIVIASHDTNRAYFSENTSIGEMLLVCRRWQEEGEKPPTRFINLYENPSTPVDALAAASALRGNNPLQVKGAVQTWPSARVAAGNWGAVQYLSPYLCESFVRLKNDEIACTSPLGNLAEIGPDGRGIRDMFKRSVVPDVDARVGLWDHKTDFVQTLAAKNDTYIVAKKGKERQAKNLWAKRGTLLLPMRARLNTVRVLGVRLQQRMLGSAWTPCKFIASEEKLDSVAAEKALCAYLSSTIGILALTGNRSMKDMSYSQFSMDDLKRIPVPDFPNMDAARLQILADAYDALCESVLLPLPQIMQDETRQALDDAVIAALDIDREVVANIRRELSREPSITGKPYQP